MTREELLDQIAIEVLKNLPHNFASDAYNIAESFAAFVRGMKQ